MMMIDEEERWPLVQEMCLAANCSTDEKDRVNKPEQLLGCYCDPGAERLESDLWVSVEERADLQRRRRTQDTSSIANDLQLPSRADGILLTTGNLEDVTVSSGAMTGLDVATDVVVNAFLQFGSGGHAGECGWTECNEKAHVRTSGLVLTTTDLERGWARIEHAWCSNIAADALHDASVDPDALGEAGGEVCGLSGSGEHCFRFINGSLSDCFDACDSAECSAILASRFNVVELWWNHSDSISVSALGTLQTERVPTLGRVTMAWEMARFNCGPFSVPGITESTVRICDAVSTLGS